jgi:hypothetical protein
MALDVPEMLIIGLFIVLAWLGVRNGILRYRGPRN